MAWYIFLLKRISRQEGNGITREKVRKDTDENELDDKSGDETKREKGIENSRDKRKHPRELKIRQVSTEFTGKRDAIKRDMKNDSITQAGRCV